MVMMMWILVLECSSNGDCGVCCICRDPGWIGKRGSIIMIKRRGGGGGLQGPMCVGTY